ncbi:MAG: hypothetical protein WBB05_11905 [Mycolicibacterium fortuitum]
MSDRSAVVELGGDGAVSVSRVAAPSPPLARTAASTAAIPSNPTDAMIRLSWARLNRGFRAGSCSACAGGGAGGYGVKPVWSGFG